MNDPTEQERATAKEMADKYAGILDDMDPPRTPRKNTLSYELEQDIAAALGASRRKALVDAASAANDLGTRCSELLETKEGLLGTRIMHGAERATWMLKGRMSAAFSIAADIQALMEKS